MIAQKKKKNQYQVNYSANLSNDKHIFQGKKKVSEPYKAGLQFKDFSESEFKECDH